MRHADELEALLGQQGHNLHQCHPQPVMKTKEHLMPDLHDDHLDEGKTIRPNFTAAKGERDAGTPPSSLIPVHKLSTPDRLHDLNLLRMTQMANERTVREQGSLPLGGLPVVPKPKVQNVIAPTNEEEDEGMKFMRMTLATVLSVATTTGVRAGLTPAEISQQMGGAQPGAPVSAAQSFGNPKEPGYRKIFDKCMNATNGVTVNIMDCINEEFDFQDKRLNSAYQSLQKVLTPTKWGVLRDEQRKWLAGRDSCDVDDDIRGGTAEMLVRADCALRKTAFRADELDALLKQQSY
jgi:uncharacterized protein YecT (DUF1311 family)